VQKYRARISGPLLDRIDLHVEVPALSFREMSGNGPSESSAAVAGRVAAARERQADRYRRGRPGGGGNPGLSSPRVGRDVETVAKDAGILSRNLVDEGAGDRDLGFPLTNARIPMSWLAPTLRLDAVGERILEGSMERLSLSARGHDRILRIARTIADLEGSDRVRSVCVAEAVQYRVLDRPVTRPMA
jgi:magnesium chelatase family protein